MGQVTISFYGRLAEACGPSADIPIDGEHCSVAELRRIVGHRFPHIGADLADPSIRVAVADEVVPDDHLVRSGAEVEFFPILSGG